MDINDKKYTSRKKALEGLKKGEILMYRFLPLKGSEKYLIVKGVSLGTITGKTISQVGKTRSASLSIDKLIEKCDLLKVSSFSEI